MVDTDDEALAALGDLVAVPEAADEIVAIPSDDAGKRVRPAIRGQTLLPHSADVA